MPGPTRPGPGIDARYEMLRWWDLWLKGHDTGIMAEPRLAIYVQHYYPPQLDIASIPGQWRYEDGWPVARVREAAWYLHPNATLDQHRPGDFVQHLLYKATMGISNRYRVPHNPAELCRDQRVDDVYSLSFTSPPLAHELEILGFPRAVLHVSTSAPLATWIVRLSDVAPDGSAHLVSKGILPGTHRTSHTVPTPLTPGEVYEVCLDLKVTSWVFAMGHRMRVSISNADFPNLWPSPMPMTTQLYGGAGYPSRILLPICPFAECPRPRFGVPDPAPETPGRPAPINQWQTTRDEMRQTVTVFRETRVPAHPVPSDDEPLTVSAVERRWCTASDVEPARASVEAEGQRVVRCGRMEIVVKARLTIHSDETAFHVTVQRELTKNGTPVRSKRWQETIARDHI
jgi:uncharacterized protein